MGRLSIFVLVFLLAAIAARVLFFDARTDAELEPLAAPLPAPLIPALRAASNSGVVDPDPDLDQPLDTTDCQGAPLEVLPWEKPVVERPEQQPTDLPR